MATVMYAGGMYPYCAKANNDLPLLEMIKEFNPFFFSRRVQLVNLASRYAITTAYPGRQFTEIGGLRSYGTNLSDAWRQLGIYTGRILNGECGLLTGT